jgi:hypothetical protein
MSASLAGVGVANDKAAYGVLSIGLTIEMHKNIVATQKPPGEPAVNDQINWKEVVEDLTKSLSVVRIASALNVSPQSIHDIKAERTKEPRASLAMGLLRLQKREKAIAARREALDAKERRL